MGDHATGWDHTMPFPDDNAADQAFRILVRGWIAANCPPGLRHRAMRVDPPELQPWHRLLCDRGWIAPHWPQEHGGMGATLTQQLILFEEMARAGAPPPFPHGLNFIGPLIIDAGTPAQQARFLPGILTGETTWCQGYSEPGAGSDLARLAMRADRDGDVFVVNGQKTWTTNGHHADYMFALVRTDADAQPRHAGISMLLIDLRSSGITIRPIQTVKGDAEFAEEFFDNVRVPAENLLGTLNDGWRLANRLLGTERFTTGHPRNAATLLHQARQVARVTGAAANQAFCARLAELEIDLLAFSAFYRDAARLQGLGRTPASMAPVIKIVGGELWQSASELLMQAGGTLGPMVEDQVFGDLVLNLGAELLEARRATIGSGTVEIQRNVIARRVLALPG